VPNIESRRISEPFFLFWLHPILHPNQPSDISASHTVGKGGSPAKEESSSPGSHRVGFYSRLRNVCLSCLLELADVGGLLQIIMVKRGSHSFPVRLPDSQLAGVFVPTHDHLPHLADNRPRALRG